MILAVVLSGATAARGEATKASPLLFPAPAKVEPEAGAFALAGAQVHVDDAGGRAAAARLAELLRRSGKPAPALAAKGKIRFVRDPSIASAEGYRLTVRPEAVTLAASGDAGLFYGAQALWQLMVESRGGTIGAVTITDAPKYAWRGTMLDSVRHMQSPAFIKQVIDRMALVGLNRFHWHLTDDQGWRFPVPGYPRLTQVAAWRQQAGAAGFDPQTGQPVRYGGYYTPAQIREIVAYARARHIEVVPEVDFPGHATAAIAAYPGLASNFAPPAAPGADWGVYHNIIKPDEQGLKFARAVLDEVMRLFPGKHIHVGGDEAVKDYWKANPAIQAQIRALGLKDENALQGWFMAQLGAHVGRQGRRIVGWDEVLEGEVPGDAVVMSWRGASGALVAARAGHDAILAPAPDYYIDNKQSQSDEEPSGRGLVISWQRLYDFDPGISALSETERERIIGLQANLWTEHVRTEDYAQAMLWPRAAVLAQLAWSGRAGDWNRFGPLLVWQIEREARLGYGSSRVSLDPLARFDAGSGPGRVAVELTQPAAIGTLRYTLDGSVPQAGSPRYAGPLELAEGTRLRVRAFLDARPLGQERSWQAGIALARTRAGNDLGACAAGVELRMEDDAPTNGKRLVHQAEIFNPCWIWPKAPLDGVTRLAARVGTRPYNFQLSHDAGRIQTGQPQTEAGELVVRLDGCAGPELARLPLAPLVGKQGINELGARLKAPLSGRHDLCITFARPRIDPLWVLDRLTLEP
ncbi:MAG TPA: family 20 glycosylhydrolase [Novosphingobium sp.]|nr:family 20 glycosylhydrolase [Novosphingobium sp.]